MGSGEGGSGQGASGGRAKYLGPGLVREARTLNKTSGHGCDSQEGWGPVITCLPWGPTLALASLETCRCLFLPYSVLSNT